MVFSGQSQVSGIGSFIPREVVTSIDILEDLKTESRFGIPKTWMDENLEIFSRRYCDDGDNPSDIATIAGLRALSDASIEASDLDAVIYCGITGDFIEPCTAHVIQNNISAGNAICKDVNNACHGFCDGVFFADLMIGGGAKNVLVVTAELTRAGRFAMPFLMSTAKKKDFLGRLGAITLGDAAGAVVLSAKTHTEKGIQSVNSSSCGESVNLCTYNLEDGILLGNMNMQEICKSVFKQSLALLPESLARSKWSKEEISSLVMHQVGGAPHRKMIEVAGFANAFIPKTFNELGNITTATLPINLEMVKRRINNMRQKICILGGGSGISSSVIMLTL